MRPLAQNFDVIVQKAFPVSSLSILCISSLQSVSNKKNRSELLILYLILNRIFGGKSAQMKGFSLLLIQCSMDEKRARVIAALFNCQTYACAKLECNFFDFGYFHIPVETRKKQQ
jgi:hypothetical protein